MAEIKYQAVVMCRKGPEAVEGSAELGPGATHIRIELPQGNVRSIKAITTIEIENDEKIFMNGYQSWTHSPEWNPSDHMKPTAGRVPKFFVNQYGLESYGDYHFMTYPDTFGRFHGFSWCYFRKGDKFRLFASLDERPGYTIFRFNSLTDQLDIERDCAGLRVGGEYAAFDLFYAEGSSDQVFDAWFKELGIKPRTTQKRSGYSTWFYNYSNFTAKTVSDYLEGASKVLKPGDLFLIDDGWENFPGDWTPEFSKFPNHFEDSIKAIHDRGLLAGLTLAPFAMQDNRTFMYDHKDWLFKANGSKWCAGRNSWGTLYSMDIDNPSLGYYLRDTFERLFEDWNIDFVKLNMLYCAAPFGTDHDTRAGRMIKALEMCREWCGDRIMIADGVPLMPAFGIADYCRVTCDVGLDWNGKGLWSKIQRERASTMNTIEDSCTRRQLNGRAFLSDTASVFFRDDNIRMNEREKEALQTSTAAYSGLMMCSDDFNKYDKKMTAAYNKVRETFENTPLPEY